MSREIVVVVWTDASCDNAWQDHNATFERVPVTTCGFLWHYDELTVVIVGTVSENGYFTQTMIIPRGMVVSVKDTNGVDVDLEVVLSVPDNDDVRDEHDAVLIPGPIC